MDRVIEINKKDIQRQCERCGAYRSAEEFTDSFCQRCSEIERRLARKRSDLVRFIEELDGCMAAFDEGVKRLRKFLKK
jgi:Zn finger protein HypA/HybF involved in hydrogenase expression